MSNCHDTLLWCGDRSRSIIVVAVGALALNQACLAQKSVGEAWRQRTQQNNASDSAVDEAASGSLPLGNDVIAYVGERPITRDRLTDLLFKGHGPALLDLLIVLESAEAVADARGITISSADLESEYERSLRTIANPTGLTEIDEFDRIAAEGMLSAILAERNISRAEYLLSMRRNALLRKICEADMAPSDAEIEQQYLREHGEKVRIRRIVVSTSEEAMHILRQMGHGLSFEDLARRFNTSPSAAARDGLMPPFTTAHDEVPAELRATAFTTPVLEMTAPFEVDGSFYIIQVEEKTPADEVPITSVRGELITHWKERMLPGRMQALHKRLHSQSEVTIVDPTLRRAFRERSETMP